MIYKLHFVFTLIIFGQRLNLYDDQSHLSVTDKKIHLFNLNKDKEKCLFLCNFRNKQWSAVPFCTPGF